MRYFRKREVNNGTFSPIDNLYPLSENSESAPVQLLLNGGTRKVQNAVMLEALSGKIQ